MSKKLRLELDEIRVDSFELTAETGRGTVQAHACAVCGCDPCCCSCCYTCAATCAASCQTCPDSCWGTCADPTCVGRSCDWCPSDDCTYYYYGAAGGDQAAMLPICY